VNYYRRFIKDFSQLTRPINNLLKNNTAEQWDEKCNRSFNDIKAQVAKEPVIRHFDYGKEAFVEYDSSDTVIVGVLLQKDENGQLRPVAYFSTSLGPAERNYAIYDKELLTIIRCFEE